MKRIRQISGDSIHIAQVNGDEPQQMREIITSTMVGGVKDYDLLDNKPSIGGVTVQGAKTLTDYGLPTIPTKVSDLTNDAGYITSYTETDPTVPSWAKQPTKPTYTASEVGALPDSTVIPTKTSDLQNDSGFITGYAETDPTVPAWAKQPSKPTYTASEVGALPSTTAIPTKVSDLTNDSGYLTAESDPTVPSWAKQPSKPTYTATEVGALPNTTPIPSKTSDLTNDSGFTTADKLEVTTDETSAVGTAVVGTSKTVAPNYIPGGDITVPELDYEFKDGKLYIYGIKQPKFVGSGVKLILKEQDE